MDTTSRAMAEALEAGELELTGERADLFRNDLADGLARARELEALRPHIVRVPHPFEDDPPEPVIAWQDEDGESAMPDPDSDDGIAYGHGGGRRYVGPATCPDCGRGLDSRILTDGRAVMACTRLTE